MTDQSAPLVCNQKELADVLGVSITTIQTYRSKGMPVLSQGANGKGFEFDAKACVAWLREYKESSKADDEVRRAALAELQTSLFGEDEESDPYGLTNGVSSSEIKRLYEVARLRTAAELENGKLTRTNRVEAEISQMLAYLRAQLLGLPDVLTRSAGLSPQQADAVHRSIVETIDTIYTDLKRDEIPHGDR